MPMLFVLLWSTGFIGARLTAPDAEPLSFLVYRFAIVAVVLGLWSLAVRAPWPTRTQALQAAVAGALMHGGYLGSVYWAVFNGMPAGVSALIVGLQPLMTAFIAAPVLGERITIRHWLGLIIGIAGVAMVVWPKFTWSDVGITPATVAVSVFGTLCFAAGSIIQKQYCARHDMRTGNTVQFIAGTVVVLTLAHFTESFAIEWTGSVIFAMFWTVFVLSIGAITLLFILIRHGNVSRVAGMFYLVPGVTAIIAWAWFGETLVLVQILGMIVCAGAVMMVMSRPTRRA
jgi:drug/metabolite transporter (DMT)-like permease